MSYVVLQSSDETKFKVDRKIAEVSLVIKAMLGSIGADDENVGEIIPIPEVNGETLGKIIAWASHHVNDPDDEEEDEYSAPPVISDWDKDFLKDSDMKDLALIINGANFLNVEGLIDIGCKTVANRMRDCETIGELRSFLRAKNDFSPEDDVGDNRKTEWDSLNE